MMYMKKCLLLFLNDLSCQKEQIINKIGVSTGTKTNPSQMSAIVAILLLVRRQIFTESSTYGAPKTTQFGQNDLADNRERLALSQLGYSSRTGPSGQFFH